MGPRMWTSSTTCYNNIDISKTRCEKISWRDSGHLIMTLATGEGGREGKEGRREGDWDQEDVTSLPLYYILFNVIGNKFCEDIYSGADKICWSHILPRS